MSRTIIGYTSGVYDLFHIGHLNLLKNAKGLCDKLIVGVSVDELVAYKHKRAVIPFQERLEIVRSIKYVDAAIPQDDLDKFKMWEKLHFDVLFVGDDWFNTPSWKEMEAKFATVGVRVVYFPRTKGTSSTMLSATLKKLREGDGKCNFSSRRSRRGVLSRASAACACGGARGSRTCRSRRSSCGASC